MIEDVSIIIGFRYANEHRWKSLLYVLNYYIRILPDIEIIVIEQDSIAKCDIFQFPDNVKHHFIFNDGLYNRCWGYNVGAKMSQGNIFVFSDSDAFISKNDFIKNIDKLDKFEASTPNSIVCKNITLPSGNDFDVINIIEKREIWTFAAMICFFRRSSFERIGGWDERFEGWGAEDNAFSHLVFSSMSNFTFDQTIYHIDHPRSQFDGKFQPKYEENYNLSQIICDYGENAILRYIDFLNSSQLGDSNKFLEKTDSEAENLNFILLVTTFNRLQYLKRFVNSWNNTKSDSIWKLIIADDGSTDGTIKYLEVLEKNEDVEVIYSCKRDVCYQKNILLNKLVDYEFDMAFICDDDVFFKKSGWHIKYYNTAIRTLYHHLVFYDSSWKLSNNLDVPFNLGLVESRMKPENCQGAFFTVTKELLNRVGYFDRNSFGFRGLEHVDYSLRASRAGFNDSTKIYDIADSNEFIELQGATNYVKSISFEDESKLIAEDLIRRKADILMLNRIFVPFNLVDSKHKYKGISNTVKIKKNKKTKKILSKKEIEKYKLADDKFYPDRGIYGVLGFLLKRIYNFHIKNSLNYLPNSIKGIGKQLNRISNDLNSISN
tara:strand:- start:14955 stop:16763 length:1809 start_codon:yes stop_codon:yes gene_type:complete